MDISVLIRATWPYFKFSSFQLFQNEKKKQAQKFLNNFQSLILTTLLIIISDQTLCSSQKFVMSMEKKLTLIFWLIWSEISDKKPVWTSSYQFIPYHLSEIIDLKKRHGLTKSQFSSIPCIINIQYYLAKNLNIPTFKTIYVIMFGVDAKMDEVFVDCFKANHCKKVCP